MSSSNLAQSVSSSVGRTVAGWVERRPTQRRPEMMREEVVVVGMRGAMWEIRVLGKGLEHGRSERRGNAGEG